jgi:eukaryotic-like serine/threonine-protein kinase
MQADRWKRIQELYEAAVALPPEKRAGFLEQECPVDIALRGEVQSLLAQQADSFLETGPVSAIKTLTPGAKLGNFEIVEMIGRGGMGEVYRARDPRLKRDVAIKVSQERFSDRFEREARAVAALNHPNICTLYDVGPNYLVMEYIEGAPLKGPMPVDQALKYALQICEALEAAHKKGIVHRDLKPANILVNASGVKLLDFGIAQIQSTSESADDATRTIGDTRAGTILGTAAYMSPEQVEAKPVDARSDIFCFGALLYEMLSGRRAFHGDSAIGMMAAVLHKEPAPLDLPPEFHSVIAHCLRKSPAERYQSAVELGAALRPLLATKAHGQQPSIAVLPFTNRSRDADDEYFSDGLSEEIINALVKVPGLKVMARTSAFAFKGQNTDIRKIAEVLGVASVLEGSVRRAGNRIRVTAQLVTAADGSHLWSERYDRQMEDIFDVQDEIARAIADQLKVTLGVGVKQATKNLEAYELYLKGRHLANQRLPETVRRAIKAFEQAIKLDPEFALAYSGVADCYGILRVYGWISAEDGGPPALAAISKAVGLAPNLWEVIFSRGFYAFYFGRNWRDAGADFQKAVLCNPQSSIAHGYMAIFHAMTRHADEAVAHVMQACRNDPVSPYIHGVTSMCLHLLGQVDKAESYARKALDLQPNYLFGLWMLGLSLCSLGRYEEAVETMEQVVAFSRAPIFIGLLGCAYHVAGRAEDANRLLRELEERRSRGEFVPSMSFLNIFAGAGDIPAARRALSESIAESCPAFTMSITSLSFIKTIRTDPEINRMLVELLGYGSTPSARSAPNCSAF